jgi:hypothetical protein
MSDSINGSIGFFGESPTASVGASVTWSNSQTRSSPDVDIAAYTRSNSATWMFNLNQPSTLAATSSMEIYVQALFRLQGFSPYYLAYLDYSQGTPPTPTESIDPTTGLSPLTAQQYQAWTAALNSQQRETLVSQRAFSYRSHPAFFPNRFPSHFAVEYPPYGPCHRDLRNAGCGHEQRSVGSIPNEARRNHAPGKPRSWTKLCNSRLPRLRGQELSIGIK